MGHSNIWNAHPKHYGPGSRTCRVCGNPHAIIRKYMDSCAAGSASAAMQKKLVSLSTADHNRFQFSMSHIWDSFLSMLAKY